MRIRLLIFLLFIIYATGCGGDDEFTLTIYNNLDVPVLIYVDGTERVKLAARAEFVLYDLTGGQHILSAISEGYEPMMDSVNVDQDVEWVIQREEE